MILAMFRQRVKKDYPADTFIPRPARICAIIQLCLAFSVLLWNISEPFIGEIFTLKSKLLLYHDVMGIPSPNQGIHKERLIRNAERFKVLSKQMQEQVAKNSQFLQKQLQRSFWDKLKSVAILFAYKISPFELAWIFFSIVIVIMLLKKVEGASQAVWLLPILVACYAADNRLSNKRKFFCKAQTFPFRKGARGQLSSKSFK